METAAAIDDVLAMAMTSQESRIEIRIKTLNDHSFALQVRPGIAVSELKEMVRTTTQVPEHRQRLIYRGKLMKDADQLAAYNVEDGHTLHLVAKPEQIYSADGTSASETEPLLPPTRSILRPQLRPRQSRLDSAAAFASMRRRLGLDEDGSLLSDALNFRRTQPTAPLPSDNDTNLDSTPEPEPEARPPAIAHDPFEHIEQGLLTIRTLLSTVSSTTPPATTSAERGATLRARRVFYAGQWLDVKDTVNQWLEGTVLELSATHVLIHYHGWPTRWDEWIEKISPRLAAFRTRTLHPTGSPFQSPTPIVRSARSTPPPTARSLVPQIRDALRDMLPYVDHLATLCDEPDATPALAEAADVVGSLFDRVGRVLVDAATHVESFATPHRIDNDAYVSPRSASRRGTPSTDSTFRELIAVSTPLLEPPAPRRNIDVHIHAILAPPPMPPSLFDHPDLVESEARWRELTERMQASLQRSLLSPGIETSMPLVETPSLLGPRRRPVAIPEMMTGSRHAVPSFLDVLQRTMPPLRPVMRDAEAAIARAFFDELPLAPTESSSP